MEAVKATTKINKLLNDFIACHYSNGALASFMKSPEAQYIYLLIMNSHYNKDPICVETLINMVCPKFCSRQTVKNITTASIESNFLNKIVDKQDKRRKLFVPTEKTILEFENWIKNFDYL